MGGLEVEKAFLQHWFGRMLGAQAHERLAAQGGFMDAESLRKELSRILEMDRVWELLGSTTVETCGRDLLELTLLLEGAQREHTEQELSIAKALPGMIREAVAEKLADMPVS